MDGRARYAPEKWKTRKHIINNLENLIAEHANASEHYYERWKETQADSDWEDYIKIDYCKDILKDIRHHL